MFEEAAVAQARVLLVSLYEYVNEVSLAIAKVEYEIRYRPRRGLLIYQRRRIDELRQELYEAHPIIDGLYTRFPSTRDEMRTDIEDVGRGVSAGRGRRRL